MIHRKIAFERRYLVDLQPTQFSYNGKLLSPSLKTRYYSILLNLRRRQVQVVTRRMGQKFVVWTEFDYSFIFSGCHILISFCQTKLNTHTRTQTYVSKRFVQRFVVRPRYSHHVQDQARFLFQYSPLFNPQISPGGVAILGSHY